MIMLCGVLPLLKFWLPRLRLHQMTNTTATTIRNTIPATPPTIAPTGI